MQMGRRGRNTEPLEGKSSDHTERIRKMRAQRRRELAEESGQQTKAVNVPLRPGEYVGSGQ